MKTYKIDEKALKGIVNYLKLVVVPAQVGAELNNVANFINELVAEEDKKVENKVENKEEIIDKKDK